MREALDSTVHVEQHTPDVHEDNRRPDISYLDHRGMRQWIDVAIVTSWARAWPAEPQVARAGALAAAMEGAKSRKFIFHSAVPMLFLPLMERAKKSSCYYYYYFYDYFSYYYYYY